VKGVEREGVHPGLVSGFEIEEGVQLDARTIQKLKGLAEQREGFLFREEMIEALGVDELGILEEEDLIEALFQEGVLVVDGGEDAEVEGSGGDGRDPQESGEYDIDPLEADAVSLYLAQAGNHPLLKAAEEVELAKKIEKMTMAGRRLSVDGLTVFKRKRLSRVVEEGKSARERLIGSNFRLVVSIAKRYKERGVPFLDLIQEGNIGLMKATTKFEWRRGFKFSTYATWWIRQAITRAIAEQARVIRVPVHMSDEISRVKKLKNRMMQELGRDPTENEISEETGLNPVKVRLLQRAAEYPLSLDAPSGDDDSSDLGELQSDGGAADPRDQVEENILAEAVREVVSGLPFREALVIKMRYGLLDGYIYTLEEVGKKLGITRERVRQIEASGFGKLRRPIRAQRLKGFL